MFLRRHPSFSELSASCALLRALTTPKNATWGLEILLESYREPVGFTPARFCPNLSGSCTKLEAAMVQHHLKNELLHSP